MKLSLVKTLKNNLYLLYILARTLYFKLRFHKILHSRAVKKTDILFSTYLMNWRKMGGSYSPQWGDIMLGEITTAVSKSFRILSLDEDPHHLFRLYKRSMDKFRLCDFCLPLEIFFNISLIVRAYVLSLHWRTKSYIGEYRDFLQIMGGEGKMSSIFHLLLAESILDRTGPRLLFLSCEYSRFHRALIYVAKTRGIPTLALQHGVITPKHVGYILKDRNYTMLLPTLTCVYGKQYREILLKHSIYTEEMVTVTGSPRYDFLHSASELYSRERVQKKLNIPPEDRIILWTTQTHALSMEENRENLSCILRTITEVSNVTLIIKQHPAETKKDTSLIKDYIEKYSANNVAIESKDSDTYELIFASDLLITRGSTTALEAVALNKPVIVLNLSGQTDHVDYVEGGIALGVRQPEDLKPAIEKLLKDDSILAKNRAKYIEKYLYRIDGRATERVMKVIEEQLEKAKKS